MQSVSIQSLSKTYLNGVSALKNISFDVEPGDFFALLGPNGAGKSTLIAILTSLVKKSSGYIEINGVNVDEDFVTPKSHIGVVPQEFNFNGFETVESILLHQAGYYGIPKKLAKQRSEQYLRQLDIWEKRYEIGRSLSGGMKRRLMIARALLHQPKILILDEPTAGVDIEIRRSMWQFLRELNAEGTTIILTTHYLEEAENLCRTIGIIDNGVLIEYTSMPVLLRKLESESFILYLSEACEYCPDLHPYRVTQLDLMTLEVELPRSKNISQLFFVLEKAGISVARLRNKINRLEELFLQLIKKNDH